MNTNATAQMVTSGGAGCGKQQPKPMKTTDQIAAEAAAIPLTRGKYTYVDREDADLRVLTWHCTSHGRAARSRIEDHKTIYLHKVIAERMGIVGEIDHIDNDPLNNRRSNLRGCTRTQNQANAPKSRGSTSQYKGVHWSESHSGWVAQIKHNEKVTYLGQFEDEMDAALTYDAAAKKEFGEYAKLNFPIVQKHIEKATVELRDELRQEKLALEQMARRFNKYILESRAAHASEQTLIPTAAEAKAMPF